MAITVYISGASSGLGRSLALCYARQGANLALVARRGDMLESVAAECRACGAANVLCLVADLSVADASQKSVRDTLAHFEKIDLFIANAGISRNHSPQTLTFSEFKNIHDLNVYGAIAGILEILPHMLKNKSGHIVGISSIAGFRGLPSAACYSSSKAAFTAFLESLRQDLKRTQSGVLLSVVSPGFIRTPLVDKNQHPMPLILSADQAAARIVRGITAQKPHIAFPLTMVFLASLMKILPAKLFDAILIRLPWKR